MRKARAVIEELAMRKSHRSPEFCDTSARRAPPHAALSGVAYAAAALALLFVVTVAKPVAAEEKDVLRATLANGLRVILVRNTLAPVVTTVMNYLAGADETPPGFPGMAHAQEHMMFRGSPGLSADQLADIGSLMGGRFNAATRQTATQYFFTVPASALDVALRIEAIRMRGVLDGESAWARERGAIEQEVAQDLSDPRYVLLTKLRAQMFAGTPYARDALGTRSSFDRTTGAMLHAFHDRWYAPNNAVLVAAGDLDLEATLAKVKQLFGPIPRKKLPERPNVEPRPATAQTLALETDLPYALYVIALRLPGLESPDYPAAEILADVLGSHRGELYGLVPKGAALYADFLADPLPKAGLGYAVLAFPAGGDAAALAQQARSVLQSIARDGVPPELVAAAKLQERRTAELQKNDIEGLATVWSEAVAINGLTSPDEDLARIEKVTAADVDRVARHYLDLDHAVTAVLRPAGSGKAVASSGFGGQESIPLGEAKPTALPKWAETALGRLTVPPSTVHPVVSTLENGLTLIVQPENVSDTVSVYGHIRNRPELEVPKGKEGLSEVLDQLFPYGSEALDRIAFERALDDIGADEAAGSDFSLKVLAENFDRGVELLAENELHPALPPEAFAIARRQVAETVAGRLESADYLTERALRAELYPKGDPMLREARPETVDDLTLEDVRAYHRDAFRPDLTTIMVIGKVTPDEAKAVIARHFGGWKAAGETPRTLLPPVPANPPGISAVPDKSRVQDDVVLAETLGVVRSDPDYYALELGNAVLGGTFYATRLSRDLRMNAGLVYSVTSYFDVRRTRSVYLVQYSCDPQNVSRVRNIVLREIQGIQQTPVTARELRRAKAFLLRQMPLEEASVEEIAEQTLERASLDLPLDEPTLAAGRYLALGPADVRAAFAKRLRPDGLAQVSEGPPPR
jgi:zinc protease